MLSFIKLGGRNCLTPADGRDTAFIFKAFQDYFQLLFRTPFARHRFLLSIGLFYYRPGETATFSRGHFVTLSLKHYISCF
jgi:hypothetical protein